jgi:hypothetical protein
MEEGMMKALRRGLAFAVFFTVATGCGGGGGGATGSTSHAITGTVTGATGVTVTLSGAASRTTTTDGTGHYAFAGLSSGSYTVVPSLAGHVFEPVSAAVVVNGADVSTHTSFAAAASGGATYTLSGTVSGAVQSNVVVTLGGAATGSVLTDAGGHYTFSGLTGGTYTVTASLAGYAFSPITSVTLNGASSTGNDTVAVAAPATTTLNFLTSSPLPDGQVGVPYASTVIGGISGGTSPYHYQSDSFLTGTPPIGMMVDLAGDLTGTPVKDGSYTFGVCAVDLAGSSRCGSVSLTVTPRQPLTGTWAGTWSWAGTGSNGCSFSDGGAFSMALVQTGTSFTGSTSAQGIEIRDNTTCAYMTTESASGSMDGTVSGATLAYSFTLDDAYGTMSFTGTGTAGATTITGSVTRSTGGSGSLTLTKQ